MSLDDSSLSSGHSGTRSAEMEEIIREMQRVEGVLKHLEEDIMRAEDDYFDKTPHGNIVRGWDGFLDNKPPPRKRYEGRERIFTWSSFSFWRKFMADHESSANLKDDLDDAPPLKRNKSSSLMLPSPKDPKGFMKLKQQRKRKRQDNDDDYSM